MPLLAKAFLCLTLVLTSKLQASDTVYRYDPILEKELSDYKILTKIELNDDLEESEKRRKMLAAIASIAEPKQLFPDGEPFSWSKLNSYAKARTNTRTRPTITLLNSRMGKVFGEQGLKEREQASSLTRFLIDTQYQNAEKLKDWLSVLARSEHLEDDQLACLDQTLTRLQEGLDYSLNYRQLALKELLDLLIFMHKQIRLEQNPDQVATSETTKTYTHLSQTKLIRSINRLINIIVHLTPKLDVISKSREGEQNADQPVILVASGPDNDASNRISPAEQRNSSTKVARFSEQNRKVLLPRTILESCEAVITEMFYLRGRRVKGSLKSLVARAWYNEGHLNIKDINEDLGNATENLKLIYKESSQKRSKIQTQVEKLGYTSPHLTLDTSLRAILPTLPKLTPDSAKDQGFRSLRHSLYNAQLRILFLAPVLLVHMGLDPFEGQANVIFKA